MVKAERKWKTQKLKLTFQENVQECYAFVQDKINDLEQESEDDLMQAKQYLRKIKRLNSFVRAKEEELEEIRTRVESVGCMNLSADKRPSSGNPDKLANNIVKLVMREKKYDEAIQNLYSLKAEAEERIECVPNEDYKLLLTLRYLRFKTFEEIAVEMGFTFQWIHELHKRSLIQFEELYFRKVQ